MLAEPFSVFYDRYLAELAREGINPPKAGEIVAMIYLSCNVQAWNERDNKKVKE
jgi:hypothetical protein